uniref:uncharacterized protein LOC122770768 n=1 Tax=Solea senegalensis TaxID=28829 RepID=UPI001CD89B77|nr:uncharacterized protein LOC122770768 [Solea senegalensis]
MCMLHLTHLCFHLKKTKQNHKSYLFVFFSTPPHHFLQVSTTSFKTNLSESSKPKNIDSAQCQVSTSESPSLANELDTFSIQKLELPIPFSFDQSTAQSEITLTHQSSSQQEKGDVMSFPKQCENSGLVKPSSSNPDSICQNAKDIPAGKIIMFSESTPTSSGSGSPHLDQLLTDLEEMKLKFSPETLGPPSESSDESPEDNQSNMYEDLSPEEQCPSLSDDTDHTNLGVTDTYHFQTSIQDEPELLPVALDLTSESSNDESLSIPEFPQRLCETVQPLNFGLPQSEIFSLPEIAAGCHSYTAENNLASQCENKSLIDIIQRKEEHESATGSNVSMDLTEETLTQIIQDQFPHSGVAKSVDTVQTEEFSSQSFSDFSTEADNYPGHCSFEEVIQYPTPLNGQYEQCSEQSPVTFDCFASEATSIKDATLSTTDEEDSIPPGYAEVVQSGAHSPTFEFSDPEPFFDCEQAASDFSETEPDERESRTWSGGGLPCVSHSRVLEKVNQGVLLSSGSEDYEDAPFGQESPDNVHKESEESLHSSEASDEEFTLCEAPQLPPICKTGANVETDNSLARVR